jgi:hypothetical protein
MGGRASLGIFGRFAASFGARVRDRPTTLEGLEVGALGVDRRVDEQVARCLAVVADPVALRQELGGLAGMTSQRAQFAYCLFSLDLARLGESEARASFSRHAGILLEAHRDPDLTRYLLGENAELAKRWQTFVPLLVEFDKARSASEEEQASGPQILSTVPAPAITLPPGAAELSALFGTPLPGAVTAEGPPDAALAVTVEACFAARGDLAALQAAMEALLAFPSSDRLSFALCLFDLERVRRGADAAKADFAAGTGQLLAAYRDAQLAAQLIGDSPGLRALWTDLVPYLEEFFEGPDDDAYEVVEEAPAPAEEVHAVDDLQIEEAPLEIEVQADDTELALEVVEEAPASARPPPPPNVTPPPGRVAAITGPGLPAGRPANPSYRRASLPPRPPPPPSPVASPETLAFWAHTERTLSLLPDEHGQLSGRQVFGTQSREQRAALKHLARDVLERFPGSPEARALGCLIELYVAAQQKEKTLFGKPNDKRQLALQDALSLLAADPVAAAHVAVLFEWDGPETVVAFGMVVDAMQRFLAHCARERLDPLTPAAVQAFKG